MARSLRSPDDQDRAALTGASLLDDPAPGMLDLVHGRAPKAAEILASEMRRKILSRGLEPGDALPSEADIIAQRGLSRATVREALRLLEAEGMIEVKRGARGGVSVGQPSPAHVARSLALLLTVQAATWRELFEFRKLVEPAASAAAATHATDAERAEILAVARAAGPDGTGYAHHVFHVLLAQASGNQIFGLVLAAVEQSVHWFSAGEDLSEWDTIAAAKAHLRIATAVAEGDAREAERLMRGHLDAFAAAADDAGILDKPLLPRSRWSGPTELRGI
jgi:GntR family transcriptional repressor for pyruvate dehydrogenase complex